MGAQALLCEDSAGLGHREETDRAAAALIANSDLTEQDANPCLPALRSARRADLIDALLSAAATRQALSPQGLRTLGLAQEAEGKLDLARATLENSFAADPKSVVLLEDLSRVAQAAGDYKGALGLLLRTHATSSRTTPIWLTNSEASAPGWAGLGEARKANAEALKLDPENADYNLGMGTIVSFSSDPSQAIPYLMKYQAKHPQDPAGMLILGEAYYRGKDFESATAWLKRAVPHASTAAGGALLSWQDCSSGNRLDEAIAELNQSLALRPGQPEALAELGQIAVTRREFFGRRIL